MRKIASLKWQFLLCYYFIYKHEIIWVVPETQNVRIRKHQKSKELKKDYHHHCREYSEPGNSNQQKYKF